MNIPKSIAAALVAAQTALSHVEKGSTNTFHKYDYAGSEDVIRASRRALHGAGLAVARVGWVILQGEVDYDEKGQRRVLREDRVSVRYLLTHRDGESVVFPEFESPAIPEKGRPADKATSAALTLNTTYFLVGLLALERGEGPNDVDQRDDRNYDPNAPRAAAPAAKAPAKAKPGATWKHPETGEEIAVPKKLSDATDPATLRAFLETKRPQLEGAKGEARDEYRRRIQEIADKVGADGPMAWAWCGLDDKAAAA